MKLETTRYMIMSSVLFLYNLIIYLITEYFFGNLLKLRVINFSWKSQITLAMRHFFIFGPQVIIFIHNLFKLVHLLLGDQNIFPFFWGRSILNFSKRVLFILPFWLGGKIIDYLSLFPLGPDQITWLHLTITPNSPPRPGF